VRPLLSVKGLRTYFFLRRGVARAVDDVSFEVDPGEAVGIIGESGSGKSVAVQSLLRLTFPPGRIVGGEAWFQGRDLLRLSEDELREIRGRRIAMIFQNPRHCLNPVMTIGEQVGRLGRLHRRDSARQAADRTGHLLEQVQIADRERVFHAYPHQLSGGMCQRVMIMMALVCEPTLMIADEPTTGLDVTIQRQILALMRDLWERTGVARITISHDMGVIAHTCRRVVVMYAGKVMEVGPVQDVYREPLHPYTRRLIQAVPRLDTSAKPLGIGGELPSPFTPPAGCRFHPRCTEAIEVCRREQPPLLTVAEGRQVACHLVGAGRP
jgi:oligopeptide/dipeptide ABC transporter ATP-binding protein